MMRAQDFNRGQQRGAASGELRGEQLAKLAAQESSVPVEVDGQLGMPVGVGT